MKWEERSHSSQRQHEILDCCSLSTSRHRWWSIEESPVVGHVRASPARAPCVWDANGGRARPRRVVISRLLILGAPGSLGRHVLRQAVAGYEVTVFVRTPSKLPTEVRERASEHTGDLNALVPLDLIRGTDALINCAGHVADGEAFVGLIDTAVPSRHATTDVTRANEQCCCKA